MALTDEQKKAIRDLVRKRLAEGKAPLTTQGRIAALKYRKAINKRPA